MSKVWIHAFPFALICLASYSAVCYGWWNIRLDKCKSEKHFLLCFLGVFGGFIVTVWSGIILAIKLGF